MTSSQPAGVIWPADVIHVNEDGWVLINRGSQHGVCAGLRLLVVGDSIRELSDLFAPGASDAADSPPPVLRIRRTYELLEVIHTEETCCIAIAMRTPASRRPTVYRGPERELLVWVPLPEGYTWPPSNKSDTPQQPATRPWASSSDDEQATDDDTSADDTSTEEDSPPQHALQEDELWEEALPLNSVSVGDVVLPAIPAAPPSPATASPSMPSASLDAASSAATSAHASTTPFDAGRTYDWMKKPGD
ncbi:MAG TPA: hypothetical protein VFU63_03945 [Ktedonobacterales bacterium]|nr:hypothetical protein [Ktedonobacterales bacterium]